MKHLRFRGLLILAILVTILSSVTAFAGNGIVPHWDYLVMISADMEVNNYNSATVSVDVYSDSNDVDELRITVKLQQFDGGWSNYKTWTETIKDSSAMFDKKAAIPKGYSYQIEVTAKAYKNGKFLESATEVFDYGFYQ